MTTIVLILFIIIACFLIVKSSKNVSPQPNKESSLPKVVHKGYTKSSLAKDTFIVVDTETTGLSPASEEIIQLSAIKYINGQQTEIYNSYINPGKPIPVAASRINKIYDKDVKDSPYIAEILPDFINFIEDLPLVAHNASFDMGFIQTALVTCGFNPLTNPVVDTLSLARKHIDTKNHKLETLKNHFNLKLLSHNAIDDCLVTAHVYLHCINLSKNNQTKSVQEPAVEITNSSNIIKKAPKPSPVASDLELECFNVISTLLESKNRDISILRHYKGTAYFSVMAFSNLCKIKISSRLRYILVEERYASLLPNDVTLLPSAKSDGKAIRVAFTNPADLLNLEDYLCASYDFCQECITDCIANIASGEKSFQEYLNQ